MVKIKNIIFINKSPIEGTDFSTVPKCTQVKFISNHIFSRIFCLCEIKHFNRKNREYIFSVCLILFYFYFYQTIIHIAKHLINTQFQWTETTLPLNTHFQSLSPLEDGKLINLVESILRFWRFFFSKMMTMGYCTFPHLPLEKDFVLHLKKNWLEILLAMINFATLIEIDLVE